MIEIIIPQENIENKIDLVDLQKMEKNRKFLNVNIDLNFLF